MQGRRPRLPVRLPFVFLHQPEQIDVLLRERKVARRGSCRVGASPRCINAEWLSDRMNASPVDDGSGRFAPRRPRPRPPSCVAAAELRVRPAHRQRHCRPRRRRRRRRSTFVATHVVARIVIVPGSSPRSLSDPSTTGAATRGCSSAGWWRGHGVVPTFEVGKRRQVLRGPPMSAPGLQVAPRTRESHPRVGVRLVVICFLTPRLGETEKAYGAFSCPWRLPGAPTAAQDAKRLFGSDFGERRSWTRPGAGSGFHAASGLLEGGAARRSSTSARADVGGRSRSSGASCWRGVVPIEDDRVPIDVHHRERRPSFSGDSATIRRRPPRVGPVVSRRSTSTTSALVAVPATLPGVTTTSFVCSATSSRERALEARHDHPAAPWM